MLDDTDSSDAQNGDESPGNIATTSRHLGFVEVESSSDCDLGCNEQTENDIVARASVKYLSDGESIIEIVSSDDDCTKNTAVTTGKHLGFIEVESSSDKDAGMKLCLPGGDIGATGQHLGYVDVESSDEEQLVAEHRALSRSNEVLDLTADI